MSEVIKDVGTPVVMDKRHEISRLSGTHGVGHVRMATESIVDISHAHPFWAYPFTDVTVVHNGQLTNYHGMKRDFESRGHFFQTMNDSELIAVMQFIFSDCLWKPFRHLPIGAWPPRETPEVVHRMSSTEYKVSQRGGTAFSLHNDQTAVEPECPLRVEFNGRFVEN